MSVIDQPLPITLGPLLYQPKPDFIAKHICDPKVTFQFGMGTGDVAQLDRYQFLADQESNPDASLTQEARSRSQNETLGTESSRNLSKDTLYMVLKEFTGPADADNPNSHSSFQITKQKLMTAQRNYWMAMDSGAGELIGERAFHDSLLSSILLDDFKRWEDRVYINEWLKTQFYYNPDNIQDGATVDLSGSPYNGEPPKIKVRDAERICVQMAMRNVPLFEGGFVRCMASPMFVYDLRQDEKFTQIAVEGASQIIPATAMREGAPGQPPFIGTYNGVDFGVGMAYQQGVMAGHGGIQGGMLVMPRGFIFDGVHYFVSTNVPQLSVTMDWQNSGAGFTDGAAARDAAIGIFFAPQSIGIALGGETPGPNIIYHNDTDWGRRLILCWQMYGDFKLIDERFVTIGRSFQS